MKDNPVFVLITEECYINRDDMWQSQSKFDFDYPVSLNCLNHSVICDQFFTLLPTSEQKKLHLVTIHSLTFFLRFPKSTSLRKEHLCFPLYYSTSCSTQTILINKRHSVSVWVIILLITEIVYMNGVHKNICQKNSQMTDKCFLLNNHS